MEPVGVSGAGDAAPAPARREMRHVPTYDDAPPTAGVDGASDALLTWPRGNQVEDREDQASSVSSRRLRVRLTSTGMPGPMVVDTVIFEMYRPLEADGFSRRISSRAAT